MRVVFLVEDALPLDRVGKDLTPTLWGLIEKGGWAPAGGRAVLATSTFPNHASFATGALPAQHRLFGNRIWSDEAGDFVCASTVGPAVDTIFAAAQRAGVSTAAVTGEDTMIASLGAAAAGIHWPAGPIDSGCPRDSLGYAANSAVLDAVDRLGALDTDLAFIHFNEPDSTQHAFGPDAPETIEQIRRSDDDLACIVDRLSPRWAETILFVVSDHEQETIDKNLDPIDLPAELAASGCPGRAVNDGMVGLIIDGPDAAEARRLLPVEDAIDLDADVTLVWGSAGQEFGAEESTLAGHHGSPRTITQVAAVSGGHPEVGRLARSLSTAVPRAIDWAPTIAALFGFDLPAATGRPLQDSAT